MDVERLASPDPHRIPHARKELLSRHGAAGFLRKDCEQVELLRSQLDLPAINSDDMAIPIDDESTGIEVRLDAPPTCHRANARSQFPNGVRLDHVVVGTQLKSNDAIGLVSARSHDDDGDVADAPQLTEHVKPVAVRESQVQQDDVDSLRSGNHVARIHDVLCLDAIPLQPSKKWNSDRRVVLHHENLHLVMVSRRMPMTQRQKRYPGFTFIRTGPHMALVASCLRSPTQEGTDVPSTPRTVRPPRARRHSTKERIISTGLATAACVGLVGVIGVRAIEQSAAAQVLTIDPVSDVTSTEPTTSTGLTQADLDAYAAQLA